jgi:diadenosine tetraphosphate (Ap4A) HIT family hydrolase
VEGFNVGINDGEVTGQTIFHCHTHLIPRRRGDVEEPMGACATCFLARGRISDQPPGGKRSNVLV